MDIGENSPLQDLEALIPGNPEEENAVDEEENEEDLEAPLIRGNPKKWTFIRKVYAILTFQMILTVGVGSVVVFVSPVTLFFASSSWLVWGLRTVLVVLLFILFCSLACHPKNFIVLALFTMTISFALFSWAFIIRKLVLESVVLTTVAVVSLTVHTFWAARSGDEFSFPGRFLLSAVIILLVFVLIRVFFPLGKFWVMIFGVPASLIFSGYIIHNTEKLIKDHYESDDYILASVAIYLGVIKRLKPKDDDDSDTV